MDSEAIFPVTLYGSSISYFTGELENYFRVRGIPYRLQAQPCRHRLFGADLPPFWTGPRTG